MGDVENANATDESKSLCRYGMAAKAFACIAGGWVSELTNCILISYSGYNRWYNSDYQRRLELYSCWYPQMYFWGAYVDSRRFCFVCLPQRILKVRKSKGQV